MPMPCFTVLVGGSRAFTSLPVQEIFLIPTSAKSYREATEICTDVYRKLKGLLEGKQSTGTSPREWSLKDSADTSPVTIKERDDSKEEEEKRQGHGKQVTFPSFDPRSSGAASLGSSHGSSDGSSAGQFRTALVDPGSGALAAPLACTVRQALDLVLHAVREAGFHMEQCSLGLNVAAADFKDMSGDGCVYDLGKWCPEAERRADPFLKVSSEQLMAFYLDLLRDYPSIVTIEDPFDKNDWDTWTSFTSKVKNLSTSCQVVGGELVVSNLINTRSALKKSACNAAVLKASQMGTVTEGIALAHLAKQNGWAIMGASVGNYRHLGDDEDLATSLCIGLGTGQVKAGAPSHSDRSSKYSQMLLLERQLQGRAVFPVGAPLFRGDF